MSTEEHTTRARFDGRAAWAMLTTEQQAEIGATALELVVTWNGQDANFTGSILTPEARPFEAADMLLNDRLLQAAQDALAEIVPALNDDSLPVPVPSILGPVCRSCGCSEEDACEGGCAWAEPDLCTDCVGA